jgi:hypothetical protein
MAPELLAFSCSWREIVDLYQNPKRAIRDGVSEDPDVE